jgi:hypothetical protein
MKKLIVMTAWFVSCSFLLFAQKSDEKLYTENLMVDSCHFLSTGKNMFFILEPGFQLILKGGEGKESTELIITVLKETRTIGGVETRIVEERESENGQLVEVSRNYFAYCSNTGSVFYFGEEVDIYGDGIIISHKGAWIAEGKNKAGIGMPGQTLIGSKYYQEIAPGVAMDRAEIISLSETFKTPAGDFTNCLKTKEGTALNPKEKEYKLYAPGIGLIQDENLLLVKYGFIR